MSEMIFKVKGMDCAEETNALRKVVGALPGIGDVKFNLHNGTMTVTTTKGAVDNKDVIAAVQKAGMSARPADNMQVEITQSSAKGLSLIQGLGKTSTDECKAGGCGCAPIPVKLIEPSPVGSGNALYRIDNMDCPTEEALIRNKLKPIDGIKAHKRCA